MLTIRQRIDIIGGASAIVIARWAANHTGHVKGWFALNTLPRLTYDTTTMGEEYSKTGPGLRVIGLILFLTMLFAFVVLSQGNSCDTTLAPDSGKGEDKYQDRGNRCEGFYEKRKLGTGTFALVSLLEGRLQYILESSVSLTVRAPDTGDLGSAPVRVRAVTRRGRPYYRMDATLPDSHVMTWPVKDVLLDNGLTADKLGVYGWIETNDRVTYVPLSAFEQGENPTSGPVVMVVRLPFDVEKTVARYYTSGAIAPAFEEVSGAALSGDLVQIVIEGVTNETIRLDIRAKHLGIQKWSMNEEFLIFVSRS